MAKKLIQQGDVLFFQEEALPESAVKQEIKDPRGVVFAEGEATGHCHATGLDAFIETFKDADDVMWASIVGQPKTVTHQEHGSVTLDPGIYKIGIVREVDPFSEEIRQVAD